ncbi:MAG: phosphatase PAP2 family protein [Rhodothermales bacterium]|nr:phosphatase PAP2 family protein [Rhodothermales bacterium]
MPRIHVSYLLILLLGLSCFAGSRPGDDRVHLLTKWNEAVLSTAEQEDGFLTLKGLRTTAMMHRAVLIALHESKASGDSNELIGLAAFRAAYEIASQSYPDHAGRWDMLLDLGGWNDATEYSRQPALSIGRSAAQQVLDKRVEDGWDAEPEYSWHPMGPGVYAEFNEHSGTPEGFIFGAGWGSVKPFALTSPDQFRVIAPPGIDSDAYTEAFNEVKSVGRNSSEARSEDETHLALWWKDFAENSHNRLARKFVNESDISFESAARMYAMLNAAIFDAYVSSFENKFYYNHWRPYTAIRWAENDGNPDTIADTSWTNTHDHTYAFPSYPSAHGTACAAAMTIMEDTFGDETPFTMRTDSVDIGGPFSGKMYMDPPTRDFKSFDDAARQCALSRLYLGIHFRYDSDEGYNLGRKVGEQVLVAADDW